MLDIRVLGQFDVRQDGESVAIPSRPAQSLLAYLALSAGIAHRREKLATLLWPDADEDNARGYLRNALWRLRRALETHLPVGSQYLLADELTIAFNPRASWCLDASVFDQRPSEAASTTTLKKAIAAYGGELLPGFSDEWAIRERERLEAVFDRIMGELLDRLTAERDWPAVLEQAEHWIAVGHAPEPAYRALMWAHSERGDRARVSTVYQRCRQALFEELGAVPSDQTRRLFEQLARGQSVLPSAGERPIGSANLAPDGPAAGEEPFQGLRAFNESDSDRFFGREGTVRRLLARLNEHRFLALIGDSGSGKSSVLRAGLMPALRHRSDGGPASSARTVSFLLTPTSHPLAALASAVTDGPDWTRSSKDLLSELMRDPRALRTHLDDSPGAIVVVDQFEELFTLCHDSFEREAFVDNLLAATEADGSAAVVIGLRADFYAHCAPYPVLREALAAHQEYLAPMDPQDLRRAMELPLERAGWVAEPGLVDMILREVGDEPGALPLLSHALLETWHRRRGRRLTLGGYAETGGVRGAIAQTAETVYQRFPPGRQALARRIFLRLTELGEGTQDTRRRAAMHEFVVGDVDENAVTSVLHDLAEARLVTLGAGSVEVAHEALIREWPTLRAWLDEDRAGLRLHRQLGEATREWLRLERDADALYRGSRLAQAREWAAGHGDELNRDERDFLDAGNALAEQEQAERDARRERELQAARRSAEAEARSARQQRRAATLLRRRAALLAIALVLAIAMAGLALVFGDQARQSASNAQASARVAFARELATASANTLELDPERSILLALEAVRTSQRVGEPPLREATEALHRTLGTSRLQQTLRASEAAVFDVAFSADGHRLASIDQAGTARIWDAVTGQQLLRLETATAGNYRGAGVAFSPDGGRLAAMYDNHAVRIWDAARGSLLIELAGHSGPATGNGGTGGPIQALAFSPDGSRLATGGTDRAVRIWNVGSGQVEREFQALAGSVTALAFSADGHLLATATLGETTARLFDVESGRQLRTFEGHRGFVAALAFSADGLLATGDEDTTAAIWDVASGSRLATLFGHASHVVRVAFDGSGTRLLTASEDDLAKVWDTGTGQLLLTLSGHSGGVLGAAWGPDGAHVATASRDASVRIWDVTPGGSRDWLTLVGHTNRVHSVAFSPDGTRIATASLDQTVRVWDALTGLPVRVFAGHTALVESVAFNPDGTRVASASEDGTVRVWDLASGTQEAVFQGADYAGDGIAAVAWAPDGERLIAQLRGSTVWMWDIASGREITRLLAPGPLGALALSPDGTRLALAEGGGSAQVWDLKAAAPAVELSGMTTDVDDIAYSPDGRLLATGGNDGFLRLWDSVSGQQLAARSGPAFGVAFSRDGRHIATGGLDRTVKIWDVDGQTLAPQEPLTLFGHTAAAYRVTWSPDSRYVATASRDGTSRVYVIPTQDLTAIAMTRVTRRLTVDECQKYLHSANCPED